MMLVGNQQKLYPEQLTGANDLLFNGAPKYTTGDHYTLYAVPNTTYNAKTEGDIEITFGNKQIAFYDFTLNVVNQ
jgi:hypothetical protein